MSRYDGLIIPRSYSEYINKTDAATLQQALQLSGVLSGAVAAGDNKAVTSNAVNTAIANLIKKEEKQFSNATEKLEFSIINGKLHIFYSSFYSGRGLFIFVLPSYNQINIIENYKEGFVVEDKTSGAEMKIQISLANWNVNLQSVVHIIL